VAKEAHESKVTAANKNTCAVVVDGDATWFNNPQFRVTTLGGHHHKPPTVYVSLVPISSEASHDGAQNVSVLVTSMARGPEAPGRVWDVGTCDIVATEKVDGAGRSKGQEVSVWALPLEHSKIYHIIPFTQKRNMEGSFLVRIYSSEPISVESMDKVYTQNFTGEWRRVGDLDSTGGPPHVAAGKSEFKLQSWIPLYLYILFISVSF